MDQHLNEALTLEWVRRGRFELVDRPDQADIVLGGTMSRLAVIPVSFDENGRATEYQMTLRASVQLLDVRGGLVGDRRRNDQPAPAALTAQRRLARVGIELVGVLDQDHHRKIFLVGIPHPAPDGALIEFDESGAWMTGPASIVFRGSVD